MKKLLLYSACLMLAFSSCKKSDKNSNSTGTNTITADVGGSAVNFNIGVTGLLSISQGTYVLYITGATGTGDNEQSMQISILSQKAITTGTYTLSSSTSPDATATPQLAYGQGATSPVAFVTDGKNVTTVTITSITTTNVQGTFSGVLTSAQDAVTTKSITSGKFNVPLITHNQ